MPVKTTDAQQPCILNLYGLWTQTCFSRPSPKGITVAASTSLLGAAGWMSRLDSDWQKLHTAALTVMTDTLNKYRESVSGDLCTSATVPLVIGSSPSRRWLSPAVSLSHAFKENSSAAECWAVQTPSYRICLSAIYFSFPCLRKTFSIYPRRRRLCQTQPHLFSLEVSGRQ